MSKVEDVLTHNATVSRNIANGYKAKGDNKAFKQHMRESLAYQRRAARLRKKNLRRLDD
jgi:hypothetical protein